MCTPVAAASVIVQKYVSTLASTTILQSSDKWMNTERAVGQSVIRQIEEKYLIKHYMKTYF